MPNQLPHELYSPKTLFTIGGASIAVVTATTACGSAFNFNPRWLGLVFAEVLSFAAIALLPRELRKSLMIYLVAFFNGTLVYCQAIGMHAINGSGPDRKQQEASFISIPGDRPWFPPAALLTEVKAAGQNLRQASTALAVAQADASSVDHQVEQLEQQVQNLHTTAQKAGAIAQQCREFISRQRPALAPADRVQATKLWDQLGEVQLLSSAVQPTLGTANRIRQTSQQHSANLLREQSNLKKAIRINTAAE
jgi:hypothetical protein